LHDLVFVAQHVSMRQEVAGILMCFGRHRCDQFAGIALSVHGVERTRDGDGSAAQTVRRAHGAFAVASKQPPLHARPVIGAR